MNILGWNPSHYGLENHGIYHTGHQYWNLPTAQLYEEIVRRREGVVAHRGPVVVRTGHHTGRSPKDRFIVKEPSSEKQIWWGTYNQPFDPEKFEYLYQRLLAYLQGRDLFIQDMYAAADPAFRMPIRIITELAWHSLFARNMFIRPDWSKGKAFVPRFTVLVCPHFHAVPELDGTNSEAFILIHFGKKLVIIGGTSYAGEIKKSVFSILNYLFPQEKVLTMHCSANVGEKGDTALFFGLSGTGKTTLSADPSRALIGDDEHGWSSEGIFNIEGGCYAKAACLSLKKEPLIWKAAMMFGSILENVAIHPITRRVDFDDVSLTENSRAAYPIPVLPGSVKEGMGHHPKNIFMLTLDAYGVLPPVAELSPEQALKWFLLGYTSKVAGTEAGLGKEPIPIFSPCFGAPFMALPPKVYANLLREKVVQHQVSCWLINTGWIKGPFGQGERIPLAYTRAILQAILQNRIAKERLVDPIFQLSIPVKLPGVPEELLLPSRLWKSEEAYRKTALQVKKRFDEAKKEP